MPCQFSGIQTAGSEFNNYVFESTGNGFKILSESESEAKVLPLEKLKDGFKYHNFLTNPAEIIADYETYGVRILMNAPIFQQAVAAAGGRRTRKNRRSFKRTKKMNKSKKYKTRKMNKSRKRR